ncbi:MAG TPA: triose-phosphate isomerase [Candidatus Paceibacterota bacterium]
MKKKIIVGNWKMNPTDFSEAKRVFGAVRKIATRLNSTHVVICPPILYAQKFASSRALSPLSIGAQNVFFEEQGHFTGEISPSMLKNIGINHVIVGHSERREMGETDEIVSKKVQAVLEIGIHPIVCVGEKNRDAHGLYLDILKSQIKNSLAKTPKKLIGQVIMAYEPIWAIGAKESMDPAMIQEMSIFVKKVLSDMFGNENIMKTVVLYGGSANFRNAPDIINLGKVDGLLVGRESVNVPGFVELLKAVDVV